MSNNLINDMLVASGELLSQGKTIVEWFDPTNKDHMTAYKAFLETRAWPVGAIPEGVALTPGWEGQLAGKLTAFEGKVPSDKDDDEQKIVQKLTEATPTDDVVPGVPNKDFQPGADVGEEEPAPEELIPDEDEHDAVEADFDKIYLGQNNTDHFYAVAKKGDTGETEDLLITDQEGKELFSAKENDVDVHDVSKFILAALDSDKVNIMEIERGVVMQYLVPQEEEEIEAEEEEEEGLEGEEMPPKEETEPKEEVPGTEAGVRTASQYRESKKIIETLSVKDKKGNTFSIQVIDEGSKDVVVQINNCEFRFTPDFAALYEMDGGKLTEQGLQDLAQEVLGHLDNGEYAEVIGSGVQEESKKNPGAAVRNRGGVVFPAGSKNVKDDKDHFPLNTEKEARAALSYVQHYTSVPSWYKGSLAELKKKVINAVHSRYPKIEISAKKKVKEDLDPSVTREVSGDSLLQRVQQLRAKKDRTPDDDTTLRQLEDELKTRGQKEQAAEGKVPSDKDDDEQKIVQKLTERTTPRVGDVVQIMDKEGNTTIIPHAKVANVNIMESEDAITVQLEGAEEWYDNTNYLIKILEPAEESKVNEMALMPKRYIITAQAFNGETGQPSGLKRDEEIDTSTNALFMNVQSMGDIERAYEAFWNQLNPDSEEVVKVFSIRAADEEEDDLEDQWKQPPARAADEEEDDLEDQWKQPPAMNVPNESKVNETEGDLLHRLAPNKGGRSGYSQGRTSSVKTEPDGLAKKAGKRPEDFNKEQLAAGTKVEMEHTDDPAKAQQIAMDHLAEDSHYYTKLKKMEAGKCGESKIKESNMKINEKGWFSKAVDALKIDEQFQKLLKEYGAASNKVYQYVSKIQGTGTKKEIIDDMIKAATGQVTEREYSDMAGQATTKSVFQVEFVLDSGEKKSTRVMAFSDNEAKAMLKRQKGVKDVISAKPAESRNESKVSGSKFMKRVKEDIRDESPGENMGTNPNEPGEDVRPDAPREDEKDVDIGGANTFFEDLVEKLYLQSDSGPVDWDTILQAAQDEVSELGHSVAEALRERGVKVRGELGEELHNPNEDFEENDEGGSTERSILDLVTSSLRDYCDQNRVNPKELTTEVVEEITGQILKSFGIPEFYQEALDKFQMSLPEEGISAEEEEKGMEPSERRSVQVARDLLGLKEKSIEDDPVKVGDLVQIVDSNTYRVEVEEAIVKAIDEKKGVEVTGSTVPVSQRWYRAPHWFISVLESNLNEDETTPDFWVQEIWREYGRQHSTKPQHYDQDVDIENLQSLAGEKWNLLLKRGWIKLRTEQGVMVAATSKENLMTHTPTDFADNAPLRSEDFDKKQDESKS